ncbi:MAG TPA: hypothetical protein VK211_11690 [Kamptonema sp.]|nr:hypothetical protein [Kamptonema sp.]
MKIVEQTSTNLVLQSLRPKWLLPLGVLFIAAGIAIILSFAQVTTFTCNPNSNKCELIVSKSIDSEVREIPLTELQGAKIEFGARPNADTYRIVLLVKNNKIPLSPIYSNLDGEKKEAMVSEINNFVKSPDKSTLKVQEDDRGVTWGLGVVLIAGGLCVAAFSFKIVSCAFDKTQGCMTLKRQNLFKTQAIEQSLAEIWDVEVEESANNSEGTYRVSLLLASGLRLPLTLDYSYGREEHQEIGDRIRKFLNLKPDLVPTGETD